MHIRTQIRNKLKEILNNLNTTQQNLFFDINNALSKNKLPCIVIQTGDEEINNKTIGYPALQERILNINIYAVVKTNEDTQDKLDIILNEVEYVLNSQINKKLNNLITSSNQTQLNFDLNGELDEDVGILQITYQFTYRCYENNTEVSI